MPKRSARTGAGHVLAWIAPASWVSWLLSSDLLTSYDLIWCFEDLKAGGASGWIVVATQPADERGRTATKASNIVEFAGRDAISDPLRAVQTGIGPVTVKALKVRSKTGKPVTFHSALVPPYVQKAKSLEAALPGLFWDHMIAS